MESVTLTDLEFVEESVMNSVVSGGSVLNGGGFCGIFCAGGAWCGIWCWP